MFLTTLRDKQGPSRDFLLQKESTVTLVLEELLEKKLKDISVINTKYVLFELLKPEIRQNLHYFPDVEVIAVLRRTKKGLADINHRNGLTHINKGRTDLRLTNERLTKERLTHSFIT